jgi:hypothetical protein
MRRGTAPARCSHVDHRLTPVDKIHTFDVGCHERVPLLMPLSYTTGFQNRTGRLRLLCNFIRLEVVDVRPVVTEHAPAPTILPNGPDTSPRDRRNGYHLTAGQKTRQTLAEKIHGFRFWMQHPTSDLTNPLPETRAVEIPCTGTPLRIEFRYESVDFCESSSAL